MPNELTVLDQKFSSQKEAEIFFYQIRDRHLGSKADVVASQDFELLRELYLKYCEYTDWPVPGEPVAFCVRNIRRGMGPNGGTTQGFVVKLSTGSEQEFSVQKAVQAIAKNRVSP